MQDSWGNEHRNIQLARLELEECDELCHGNWIEIESLQRRVDFLKNLLAENRIVLPNDYYDL